MLRIVRVHFTADDPAYATSRSAKDGAAQGPFALFLPDATPTPTLPLQGGGRRGGAPPSAGLFWEAMTAIPFHDGAPSGALEHAIRSDRRGPAGDARFGRSGSPTRS